MRDTFLSPVGRMVMGSLYDPQTKNAVGEPLVFKTGKNQGKPRVNYFFALSVRKVGENDWKDSDWGKKIYAEIAALYPAKEYLRNNFRWKIVDGDSQIPNANGIKPCDRKGYPGHWVLTFGGAFAPVILDKNGNRLDRDGAINCGDFIQVNMSISSNGAASQNVGIIFNCTHVALIGYGEPIEFKKEIDPKTLGFSQQLPPEASETPIASKVNPVNQSPTVATPPPPYPEILSPPVVAAHVMTAKAPGSYDAMITAGWTDELLIQHGMMHA